MPLSLPVQNTACVPVSSARVDIWHCDKRGVYSAYNSSQNGGDQTAYTFLRGIQTTDNNGQVTFTTIFPSWYIPRAIHFHIQVYYNNSLVLTTQLAIADSLGQTVNNTSSANSYSRNYTYTNATDMVFSDGFSAQLVSFNSDSNNTRGYIGTATVIAGVTILPIKILSFKASIESGQVALKPESCIPRCPPFTTQFVIVLLLFPPAAILPAPIRILREPAPLETTSAANEFTYRTVLLLAPFKNSMLRLELSPE